MAITQTTTTVLGATLFQDTANGNTAVSVKASSATVYLLELDNTANSAATYVKLYNLASGSVVVGTTAPDAIILVPSTTKIDVAVPSGWIFGTALSVASLTTGGTAGVTSPASAMIVRVLYA